MKILETCKEAKLKTPKWVDDSTSVKLTFFSENKAENKIEGAIEEITNNVKDKLKQVLITLIEDSGIKSNDISVKTNIPVSSVERYIKQP